MDLVTNGNTLFFYLRWNCYRTPTRPHCMGRLHVVSKGIYTHACTYLYYFLPPDKLSVEKTPKCYSLKAGKGQEPLPALQEPPSPRVLRGVLGLPGRPAEQSRSRAGGPGSRVRPLSSRAGGRQCQQSPAGKDGGGDLPQRRLMKTMTVAGPLLPFIFLPPFKRQ